MGKKKQMVERVKELMDKPLMIRNMGIVAHIDHGKTTLSDNLLAGAGMISKDLAGTQLFMDFDEEEQARGITIDAATVSMVHEYDGKEYLINLIDTPGHVDFGGDVTRAMRAVDGALVVIDAVEGAMPQTETVLRQAIKENVRPILFINKVDRLINELQVDPERLQAQLIKLIATINKLIKGMNEKKYNAGWKLDAGNGTVAFGSALYNWAISVPYMQKTGINFKDVIAYCNANDMKSLAAKAPLHEVVNDMVIKFLPNPIDAQRERVPVIWHGDKESDIGKAMIGCDPNAPVTFMVTKITQDPHAGEIAAGRLFSGTIERGQELYISGTGTTNRVQQVSLFMGPTRVEVGKVPAGNIIAVTGLKSAMVGSTATTLRDMIPFESIKHGSEPVVTVAIEAKNMKDLPKLVEVLQQVAKEDPTLQVKIDQETGEHLLSGMGELHLEVVTGRITRDRGVEIIASPPIVAYRETITGSTAAVEGKSPNRHNRFYIEAMPLEQSVVDLIKNGEISMRMAKLERREKLMEAAGWTKEEGDAIAGIYETNIFMDRTKGVQYLNETMELILDGFVEAVKNGPMSREPCQGMKFILVDVKLHEDAVHRGPAQTIPAVRQAVQAAILQSKPTLLEPMMNAYIQVPQEHMGGAMGEVQGRRGTILDMTQEGDLTIIKAKTPVARMFGFAGDLRSATEGRAMWSTEFAGFEPLPQSLLEEIVTQIRERKGLKPGIPKAADFIG